MLDLNYFTEPARKSGGISPQPVRVLNAKAQKRF